MRLPGSDRRVAFTATMTPMIDVVFLLIIFFLVSSHLAQREHRIPIDLPVAQTGSLDNDPGSHVNLQMQPDGTLWWNGNALSRDRLPQQLRQHLDAHGEFHLRLRCDRSLVYRDVEPILVAAAQAGIWNVSFAVVAGGVAP